ncbi:hypothetical protein [Streptomyces sp. Ncost-T10-10d]|uniref:hypothetical protein n=1 Tax=Streptomyces sp. Ncost-T10-10d TaxID=1839774 RepID=UPI003520EBD0
MSAPGTTPGAVAVAAAAPVAVAVPAVDAPTSRYPFFSFSAIVLRTCADAASTDAYSFVCVRPSLPHRP